MLDTKRLSLPLAVLIVVIAAIAVFLANGTKKLKYVEANHLVPCQSGDTRPECDPNKINTLGWEDSPWISRDGQYFYFMYTPWNMWPTFFGNPPEKIGPARPGHHNNPDPWEDSDVYVAVRQANGTWSAPFNHGSNDDRINCCQMAAPGNNVIFYQRNVNPPGTPSNNDIVFSVMQPDSSWSVPVAFGPEINSPYTEDNPHFSPYGDQVFFTSDRPGGYGGSDIWASFVDPVTGNWVPAFNMGSSFNTTEDEDQIWVSDDGNTVYFGRSGVYGFLKTTRNPRTNKWSRPVVERFGTSATDVVGEISFANFGQSNVEVYFGLLSFDAQDVVMVKTKKGNDGKWMTPIPVDESWPI